MKTLRPLFRSSAAGRSAFTPSASLALVLLLCLAPSAVFAKFDPSFVWSTIETPHFLVHFHQGGEETARRAGAIAEDVHGRLAPRIKWTPKDKTRLVLVDAMDEANGMASPLPYNQIILFLTSPGGDSGFGSMAMDDWLRLVITHEYTHVLHLDMVTAGPATVQSLFGRIYFPNLFQPHWLIEGLATYEETEQTAGGRGRSPSAEMVLRMAALDGPFPSLDQASIFPDTWPAGQVPYLFGESFTRYLVERYGRDKVAEISVAYSGRSFPFLVGSTGERVLGRSYDMLWFEWETSLRERFRKQAAALRAEGLTRSTALTAGGYLTLGPAYAPDGGRIAYAAADGHGFPRIMLMNADGTNSRVLVENAFPVSVPGATPAWSPDGERLYYTKGEIERNVNYYSDIYVFDVAAQREQRVTQGLRARDPQVSPDGKRLLFVMNRMGMTRLAALDLTAPRKRPAGEHDIAALIDWSQNQYETPRFSPDNSRISVSVRRPGGRKDILILDAAGAVVEAVTKDGAVDSAPAWSADGRHLFFSSDRTGVFNIHAWDLTARKLFQVTNVLGGAFSPAPSPDGKSLLFSSYGAKGYDIHHIPSAPELWRAAAPAREFTSLVYDEKPVDGPLRPYSPLSTIYPRFWLPWFGYTQESGVLAGAFTFAQDAVQRHSYAATALYGPKNSRTWYSLDYFYNGLTPTFALHAMDIDMVYSGLLADASGQSDYTEKERTFGASVIVPLTKVKSQHELMLGYRWREASALTEIPGAYAGIRPAEGVFASGRLSYLYNNARRYNFSISPEGGRTLELGYERLDRSLGGDFELNKYIADWREYLSFPWQHHVLVLRAFAGASTGDVVPQRAFQLGGDPLGDMTVSLDDRDLALRGYPVNVLRGSKAGLVTAEYRFPVQNIERGSGTSAIFFRRLHGALFGEAGSAWDGTLHRETVRRSVGAEARIDLDAGYILPITLRVGIARGLDEDGETQVIVGLWMPLLF